MLKRIAVIAFMVTLAAVPAFAQKAEVGVTFGWVYSDGVSGNTYIVPGVGSFSRIDPKDSFGWGIDVGFFIGPNAEVGFLYGNQPTTLEVSGTATRDVGDMSISTYHGTYTYNFGESDAAVRPYLTVGLGATSFGDVSFSNAVRSGTTQGATRFSSTWGAGAKFYGASKVGGRVGVRWTPAYIKSDAAGYWCDPYWGCYLVGDAQYANQLELQGGITFRF
jgi:outer membrane protein W